MEEVSWLLFVVSSLILIATPGQDMVLVMSRSLTHGAAAGAATAAGVSVGLVGHTLLATVGLGALLQASGGLFMVLKLAGAAYLIWIGIGLLRARDVTLALHGGLPRSLRRLFADGALSNLANPKIAIFYFAYLPQFVQPEAARPTLALLVLGLLFATLTFAVKGPVGLSAALLSGWLRARPQALAAIHRCSGTLLIGLGIKLALERRN